MVEVRAAFVVETDGSGGAHQQGDAQARLERLHTATECRLSLLGLARDPGLIKTNISSNMLGGEGSFKHRFVEFFIGLLMISADKYAARITPLLVSPDLEGHSPAMFNQKATPILASQVMTPHTLPTPFVPRMGCLSAQQ